MKNILFIHSSSEMYGSDRSLLNIVKTINKTEFKVHVVLPCDGPLVNEMKKVSNVNVEIFEVAVLRRKNLSIKGGLQYIFSFIKSYKYLKKYIKKNNIAIVDTNTAVVFPGAVVAKHCKIKSVWHIREIIKSNLENKVISFMMNRYSDLIIANSKATGEALKVNNNKIRVVYNAVDESKESNKRGHEAFTVGMAGRINRWKGQKLFADAAEIVVKEFPNVIFQIAGEAYTGEEHLKEDLIKYIGSKKMTNNVILLGQVDNMKEFYSGLDIFVLPSIQPEPFGLVVIEAMEYGIPVIATNHGGPTEIINNTIDGYLVDYEKPNEIAQRIIELIKDDELRIKIGETGRNKKRTMFSVTKMVKDIENIFNELV